MWRLEMTSLQKTKVQASINTSEQTTIPGSSVEYLQRGENKVSISPYDIIIPNVMISRSYVDGSQYYVGSPIPVSSFTISSTIGGGYKLYVGYDLPSK
jgi:hypothetical protein